MTRREAAEKVFNYIRANKFEPINIQYGNGYFVFDMGEDGVVHFNIKGLHGWKFAMWIETDPEKLKQENGKEYPAIQFFCQHKLNIDKFKPSRSFHLVEMSLMDIEKDKDWYFGYYIEDMLKMIKRHPFVSFAMDAYEGPYCKKSYLYEYLDTRFYNVKSSIKEWWRDWCVKIWHGSKVWFVNKYEVVDSIKLVDKNGAGFKCSPRYEMKIHFKVIFENEEEQQEAEITVLDRWFHKDYYNNMRLELTRDGVDGRYRYTTKD